MFFQKINERDSRFWPIWGDDSTPAVLVSYKGLLTTDPFPLNHSVQMSTQTFIHGMTKIRSSLSVKSFLCPGTLADRWTAFTTKVFPDPAGIILSLPCYDSAHDSVDSSCIFLLPRHEGPACCDGSATVSLHKYLVFQSVTLLYGKRGA